MTAVWPAYATLTADLAAGGEPRLERSADGAPGLARQVLARPHAPGRREAVAEIPDAHLAAWRRWLAADGWRWFDWPDPARGRTLRARIVGEAEWRQVARGVGAAPVWEARLTLEGPDL